MGSAEDANNEWIELVNTGTEEVSLEGWTLAADDGQPTATLVGSVGPGGFYLLERTDDDTVPGVAAGTIYTGAMGNDGEILTLTDASGAVVDRVDCGEGWSLGGDNTAKYTLQRTGSGWVTAESTSGRGNATESVEVPTIVEEEETEQTGGTTPRSGGKSTSKATSPAPAKKSIAPAQPALTLSLGGDVQATAGVPVRFHALAKNEKGEPADADITFSFGDGATEQGSTVSHTYNYEGTYAVVAVAETKHNGTNLSARNRVTVTVSPLELALSVVDTYSIELANTGKNEVDLTGFYLVSGKHSFRMPQGTYLMEGAHIRFPATVTKLVVVDPSSVGVFTPHKVLAARYGDVGSGEEPKASADVRGEVGDADVQDVEEVMGNVTQERAQDPALVFPQDEQERSATLASVAEAFGGTSPEKETSFVWYVLGLGALAATAGLSVVLFRREEAEVLAPLRAEEALAEWDIIEEHDQEQLEAPPPRARGRKRL